MAASIRFFEPDGWHESPNGWAPQSVTDEFEVLREEWEKFAHQQAANEEQP